MKTLIYNLKNILLTACFVMQLSLCVKAQNNRPEILWDNYGVPHIYSNTITGMYYAFGWATMHNHANLVLQLYGQARGRAAEYWGGQFLQNDEIVKKFDLPGIAKEIYLKQPMEFKSYLDAFVKGENDYCKAHPETVAEKYKQLLPLTPQDVIAHTININSIDFIALDNIYGSYADAQEGSNAIAIAPSGSADKHALLLANPHIPWNGPGRLFEVHLNAPGFNAYGVTLVGFPFLRIAFNNNLGWTQTINPINASTRYELSLKNDGYLLNGKTLPFDTKKVSFKIRQGDGSLKDSVEILKYSVQGPVVTQNTVHAYAVRIAGLHDAFAMEQYHKMATASNLKEFGSALKMMQIPMSNIIYADKTGNIMYLYDGDVPIVNRGDFWFWRGKVDGTTSGTIWSKTLPYNQLPKLVNPRTGFVQNSNDIPWTCTYPIVLNPKNYPSYLSPNDRQYTADFREQRAFDIVKNNPNLTLEKLASEQMNTILENAEKLLDQLLLAAAGSKDTTIVTAVHVLKAWDKHTDADSRGAILFSKWYDDMNTDSTYKNNWRLNDDANTPNGLKYPAYAVGILKKAAAEVFAKYGSIDVAWGDVYRFRAEGIDLPANGSPMSYRNILYRQDKDKKFRAFSGDSYVAVTDFGNPVKALVILGYGNSSQANSKHNGDQLKLMSAKKMRQALLTKTEVRNNLEEKEILNY